VEINSIKKGCQEKKEEMKGVYLKEQSLPY